MSTQPEALRLAEILSDYTGVTLAQMDEAAAELRRLHEVNAVLLEALRPIAEIDLRTQGVHHKFPWLILGARAAIAKATGESK